MLARLYDTFYEMAFGTDAAQHRRARVAEFNATSEAQYQQEKKAFEDWLLPKLDYLFEKKFDPGTPCSPLTKEEEEEKKELERMRRADEESERYRRQEFEAMKDRFHEIDQACGGDLFTNPDKLAAMRRMDKVLGKCESAEEWKEFREAVVAEVSWVMSLSPEERRKCGFGEPQPGPDVT